MKNQRIDKSLNIQQPRRHTQDIRNWINAIRAFESVTCENRSRLYDLYEDIILDGQVEATWSKRIDSLTNRELVFNVDGKEDENLTAIFQCQDMSRLIKDIIEARMWGYSLIQINNVSKDPMTGAWSIDYDLIDRNHVHPKEGYVSINPGIFTPDINYLEPPLRDYLLCVGEPTDKGFLVKVAPYVIYKRGGFGDWAQFSEMFGMPFREGIYDAFDTDAFNKLKMAMEDWGSANWMLHPAGTEIKIHDTGGSAQSSTIYKDLIELCDATIAKIIVGNTLTTDSGANGSRALGDVHKSEEENKYLSDERYLLAILNTQFKKVLSKFGVDLSKGQIWFRSPDKDWNALQVKWNVLQGLASKLPIDDDYLYEEFDIPKPANYDELKSAEEEQRKAMMERLMGGQGGNSEPDDDDDDDDPNEKKAKNAWWKGLRDFFVEALGQRAHGNRLTNSASLIDRVWNKESTTWDAQLFYEISDELIRGVATGLANGVNKTSNRLSNSYAYGEKDEAFIMALEQNVFQFSASKTLAELQAMNQALKESDGYSDFKKKASTIVTKFNDNWQRTEYHTAINVAENASTYRRQVDNSELFPYWEYKTIGDSSVREEHAALDGLILPATDNAWDRIYPPNGWNCRCYIVPKMAEEINYSGGHSKKVLDEFYQSKEWAKAKKDHFDINFSQRRAIFDRNNFYVQLRGVKVSADQYGLEMDLDKICVNYTQMTPLYNGTADDWWNAHQVNDVVQFKDYVGRTWKMNKSDYDDHTTDKKKNRSYRVTYLDAMEQVVADPDEVWINDYNQNSNPDGDPNNYVMVKYYKDNAMVVIGNIDKNEELVIRTIYPLINKIHVVERVRNGLLIKK